MRFPVWGNLITFTVACFQNYPTGIINTKHRIAGRDEHADKIQFGQKLITLSQSSIILISFPEIHVPCNVKKRRRISIIFLPQNNKTDISAAYVSLEPLLQY